jgi:leucyl/phenylalanyl-tRNA--protein transferase
MKNTQRPPFLCQFPNPNPLDSEGYCGTSENLEPELVLDALRQGVFPWSSEPVNWFSPMQRSILFPREIHLSKRWVKQVQKKNWTVKVDSNFKSVMKGCQNHPDSWVDQNFINSYGILHTAGYAHSFEVYDTDDTLIGGVYGLHMGGVFSAESMFHTESNASKIALLSLCLFMTQNNISLLDSQVLNPFTKSMGFGELHRDDFISIHRELMEDVHPLEGFIWDEAFKGEAAKDIITKFKVYLNSTS